MIAEVKSKIEIEFEFEFKVPVQAVSLFSSKVAF